MYCQVRASKKFLFQRFFFLGNRLQRIVRLNQNYLFVDKCKGLPRKITISWNFAMFVNCPTNNIKHRHISQQSFWKPAILYTAKLRSV